MSGHALGRALAGEVQLDVEALGLSGRVAAVYDEERSAIRMAWVGALDEDCGSVPATVEWVIRIRHVLRKFATPAHSEGA